MPTILLASPPAPEHDRRRNPRPAYGRLEARRQAQRPKSPGRLLSSPRLSSRTRNGAVRMTYFLYTNTPCMLLCTAHTVENLPQVHEDIGEVKPTPPSKILSALDAASSI